MSDQVYFIECAGRIKIGFTSDLQARIRSLSTSAPTPLKLLGTVDGSRSLEKAIHAKLKPFHDHLEWFRACDEVLALVKDVLERGASAIEFTEKPPRKFIHLVTTPAEPDYPQIAIRRLTAIFNRYETTIEGGTIEQSREALRAFARALDSVDRMLDHDGPFPGDAETKIQTWLDAFEKQIKHIVAVKAA